MKTLNIGNKQQFRKTIHMGFKQPEGILQETGTIIYGENLKLQSHFFRKLVV